MNYPVWYLPTLGGGILIAIIAITHVFVSHFAVGGGLYLVYSEKKGLKENQSGVLDFTRSLSKFFILITMVYGSITGVGIWFIIALVNPAATSLLIHNFVFGWATEWVFFVMEITAAFVYFYTFGKMDDKTHLKIGWIYFISAWISLVLISGIIDFMLTPGAWVQHHSFWVGFFNPSFLPSVVFRTFVATLLAGVYGYVVSAFARDDTVRTMMTRFSGKWALVSLIGAVPSGWWYLSVLPEPAKNLVMGSSPTIVTAVQYGMYAIIFILAFTLLVGLLRPTLNHRTLALVTFIAAFFFVGAFEWTREAARRPYVINNVMYSNMILKDDIPRINNEGFLPTAKWIQNAKLSPENARMAGKELFINECYACHTVGGFNNDIIQRTSGMSYGALVKYIQRIHKIRYFMPPFAGTDTEAHALAAFIAGDLNGKPIEALVHSGDSAVERGAALFDDNCSACHTPDHVGKLVMDWDEAKLRDALDRLNELVPEMPPYDGSSEQKDDIARYLYSLNHTTPAAHEADGAKLFEDNCSMCHEVTDMIGHVSKWDRAGIRNALDKLNQLVPDMPPFEGSAQEKDVLADYLYGLKGGAK